MIAISITINIFLTLDNTFSDNLKSAFYLSTPNLTVADTLTRYNYCQ